MHVKKISGVVRARAIMSDDHYGWFERVAVGVYALTPKGTEAQSVYSADIELLSVRADFIGGTGEQGSEAAT
jgi:hypothetical protein